MSDRILNYYGGGLDLGLPACLSQRFPEQGVLTPAKERAIRHEIEGVLMRRRPATVADWDDDTTDFNIASVIGRAVGQWLDWPPDRFYPPDEVRYLFFADMTPTCVEISLGRDLGLTWRFQDTFAFFQKGATFRAFIAHVRRRLVGSSHGQ